MSKDRQAVADAINARLDELGIKQKELAETSRVGVATLRRLQKAEPGERTAPVLAAVSVALRWPPGYLEAVAAGQPGPVDPTAVLREEVAQLRSEVAELRRLVEAIREGVLAGG